MTRARWIPLVGVLGAAGCFIDEGSDSTTSSMEPSSSGTSGPSMATTGGSTMTGSATEMASEATSMADSSATSVDPTTGSVDPSEGEPGSFCQESCQADADCVVSGMDQGFTCQLGRCRGPDGGCADDTACRVVYSGWVTPCVSQAECPGQVCIDIGGGVGRCATAPSDFVMCETILQQDVVMPVIEGGMDITVCANTDFVCEGSVCVNPCEDDASCEAAPGHPSCVMETGVCECTSDEDCKDAQVMGYAVCNSGVCGCAVDADCVESVNADVCTSEGSCGCSSAAVCTSTSFDGTKPVCEAL